MIARPLATAVALAVLMLSAAAGVRYAATAGLVDPEAAKRVVQVLIGLILAAQANLMPKQLGGDGRSPHVEARAQALLRFAGWSLALAGLAYAGFWLFAPLPVANVGSMTVVLGALVITLGFALRTFAGCQRAR